MEHTTTGWDAAQSGTDVAARDDLISRHMRLVHHVARQVMRSTSADVDLDELVSAGAVGLMKAIENFDPSRGLAFSTYAAPRIRGSVLDDLRRRDHAPRSIRKKQRDISRATEKLQAELGRAPSPDEVANELGIDVTKLWKWERETEYAGRVSIDATVDSGYGRAMAPKDVLAGDDEVSVEEEITRKEEVAFLRDEILNLKEQERLVLSLYYFEELKLHEIASILGVTESRISQIRSQAVANLRGRLGHLRED